MKAMNRSVGRVSACEDRRYLTQNDHVFIK